MKHMQLIVEQWDMMYKMWWPRKKRGHFKKWQKTILKISITHIDGEDVQKHMQNQNSIYVKDAMD